MERSRIETMFNPASLSPRNDEVISSIASSNNKKRAKFNERNSEEEGSGCAFRFPGMFCSSSAILPKIPISMPFQIAAPRRRRSHGNLSNHPEEFKSTPEDVEKLLVEEMTQLSIAERNRIYEELHSVPDEIEETEEFVNEHLKQLDAELNRIRDKPAYHLAYIMNEKYVTNRDFRLMFLRSARFEIGLAAKKTIAFFQRKLELFGQDKLVKDIYQEDLSEDDLACGRNGSVLVLEKPDKAGRPVCIFYQKNTNFKAAENQVSVYLDLDTGNIVKPSDKQIVSFM
jgi:hypothetical protein